MKTRKTPNFVGIADDDINFGSALSQTIIKQQNLQLAFCVHDGQRLLEQYHDVGATTLIIDLYMPYLSGMEAMQIIRQRDPALSMIGTSEVYQEDVAKMLAQQNMMYCEKSIETIEKLVIQPVTYDDVNYLGYLQDWKQRSDVYRQMREQVKDVTLSFKLAELKVMAMISQDMRNQEIADALNLSKRTVDTYIERLIEKLKVKSRAGLAFYAYEHGVCKLFCEIGKCNKCERRSIFQPLIEKNTPS